MRRAKTLSAILALAAFSTIDSLIRPDYVFGIPQRFDMKNNAGGKGAGGAGGKKIDEGGDEGDDPEPMIPKAEADKAFKSRDQAKAGIRAFAQLLGIEPSEVKIVANAGDKENPFKLEAEGLEDIPKLLEEARKARKAKKDAAGGDDHGNKWAEREAELSTAHAKQLRKMKDEHKTQAASYDKWIEAEVLTGKIRVACVAEGAIDDDQTGNFDDIVALTKGRLRVDKSFDEESGELQVKVTALKDDGTPMLDGEGKPATVRAMIADFLSKKPKFKSANFRSGPGAGGYGQQRQTPNAGPGQQNTPVNLALKFFGIPNRAA